MSTFKVGDQVRITDVSEQKDKSLAVGDIGTVVEVLTEPKELIEVFYGANVPMFVHVEGKANSAGFAGETNWPLLSSEVEPVEVAA